MHFRNWSLALALLLVAGTSQTALSADAPDKILNSSYDVSRELFKQLNPVFEQKWQARTGKPITINQSHAGSAAQARAILEGLDADVVTYNQVPDVQILHDKGNLIAANWQTRLPYKASPFYSLPVFLVRKGNPKGIKNWDDLIKPGVQVIFPNPKTSGNGRYTYLTAVAFGLTKFKGDRAKAQAFAKDLFSHVPIFDTGGRGATTTFTERNIGDVLITFEAEAYAAMREKGEDNFQIVTPSQSLLAEFPVSVVDKVVDRRGSRGVASEYLKFLYTPEAQDIIARNFYRVRNTSVVKKYAGQFAAVKLVTVEKTFGGWDKVAKDYFASGGFLDQAFVGR